MTATTASFSGRKRTHRMPASPVFLSPRSVITTSNCYEHLFHSNELWYCWVPTSRGKINSDSNRLLGEYEDWQGRVGFLEMLEKTIPIKVLGPVVFELLSRFWLIMEKIVGVFCSAWPNTMTNDNLSPVRAGYTEVEECISLFRNLFIGKNLLLPWQEIHLPHCLVTKSNTNKRKLISHLYPR